MYTNTHIYVYVCTFTYLFESLFVTRQCAVLQKIQKMIKIVYFMQGNQCAPKRERLILGTAV